MPILTISTNVSKGEISDTLIAELSSIVAQQLSKPEAYVCVHIQSDQSISFGGSSSPCAYGVLKSIGGVGGKKNNAISKALFPAITSGLGVDGDRIYIEFIDIDATAIAYNGKTFA